MEVGCHIHKTDTIQLAFSLTKGSKAINIFSTIFSPHQKASSYQEHSFFCSLTHMWCGRLASTKNQHVWHSRWHKLQILGIQVYTLSIFLKQAPSTKTFMILVIPINIYIYAVAHCHTSLRIIINISNSTCSKLQSPFIFPKSASPVFLILDHR